MSHLDNDTLAGLRWMIIEDPSIVEQPFGTSLELVAEQGLKAFDVTELDLGHPTPRGVVRYFPHIDGSRDTTRFHGERVITMTVKTFKYDNKGPNVWREYLRQFLHPELRAFLRMHFNGWQEPIRTLIRSETSDMKFSSRQPSNYEDNLVWVAPSGRFESDVLHHVIVRPEIPEGGRTYPLVYPRVYPNIGPIGGIHVHNYGNARSNPIIRIYGPITGPRVMNHSIHMEGSMMGFVEYVFKIGFEILNGDYVEINPERRTITLNGIPGNSILHQLDYESTVWWQLERGHNDIMLAGASHSSPAQLHVFWRNTYL